MALFLDEEDVWKCPKHPSRRRRTGICPTCLRERLSTLCPDCGNVRPCGCCASTTSSSSSSASSSFSRFFAGDIAGVGSVGRVSSLIDSEPSFRRSRSVAVPFLRSRSKQPELFTGGGESPGSRSTGGGFWRFLRTEKNKRSEAEDKRGRTVPGSDNAAAEEMERQRMMMMRKSRSVAVRSNPIGGGGVRPPSKGWSWFFPSPIKVFRQSKASKVTVQERSPLYRESRVYNV